MQNLLDTPDSVDSFDPHSDAYNGGFGLPVSVQDEINAFHDEMDMLRAQEAMEEQPAPEPEPAKKAYTLVIGVAPKNKFAASVITPGGKRVKAGTFKLEADAHRAADTLAKALRAGER